MSAEVSLRVSTSQCLKSTKRIRQWCECDRRSFRWPEVTMERATVCMSKRFWLFGMIWRSLEAERVRVLIGQKQDVCMLSARENGRGLQHSRRHLSVTDLSVQEKARLGDSRVIVERRQRGRRAAVSFTSVCVRVAASASRRWTPCRSFLSLRGSVTRKCDESEVVRSSAGADFGASDACCSTGAFAMSRHEQ